MIQMHAYTKNARVVQGSVVLLGLLTAGSLAAQTSDGATRESFLRAQQVIEAAMTAHGGRDIVLGARTAEWVQEERSHNTGQARIPGDTLLQVATVHSWMDLERRKLRRDLDMRFPGGDRFHFANVVDGIDGFSVDIRGNRTGIDLNRMTTPQASAFWAGTERLLPHVLLQQTVRNPGSLRYLGRVGRDGQPLDAVLYADSAGNSITLLFDPQTGLMRGHERLVSTGAQPMVSEADFSDYESVSGISVSRKLTVSVNGQPGTEVRITQVALGETLADTLFDIPAGYVEPPPPGEPAALAVADGIYVLENMPGGYRAMFVDMADHIVVLEAPHSPTHTATALRLIRSVAPDKPIRYVLATHHHADHTAGLSPYISQGAIILAGDGAGRAVRLAAPSGQEALVEEVRDRRVIGSADRRVEIHSVPNIHAETMLMFFFPAHGLIFQGDLLTVPPRGPLPPATELNESLAETIRTHQLDVKLIIGVHGRTATVAELQEIIATGRR